MQIVNEGSSKTVANFFVVLLIFYLTMFNEVYHNDIEVHHDDDNEDKNKK